MPRQTKDAAIRTKTQRAKLTPRRAPYYRRLSDRLNLGYRRLNTLPGTWIVRERKDDGSYTERKLDGVTPDDIVAANGIDILSFDEAATAARSDLAPAANEITLRQAATEWSDAKCAETDNPVRSTNYRNQARRIAGKFRDGQLVNSLTVKMIEAFRDDFLIAGADEDTQRKRRATANKELGVLKAILNRASDKHSLPISRPWEKVSKFKKPDSFGARVAVLTKAERKRLTDACDGDAIRNLIRAAFLTGCRYGELKAARVRDLDGRRLAVTGKTGRRVIVLSPAAAKLFGDLTAGTNNRDRHILLQDSGDPWIDGSQLKPFARAIAAAGLDPTVTIYAARHTYISEHLTAGVPVTALAEQCGTSVAMIEATYAHFLGDDLERWFGLEVE